MDGGEGGIDSSSVASAARTLPGRSALRLRVQTLPWAAFVDPEGSHLIFKAPNKKTPQRGVFCLDGGEGGIFSVGMHDVYKINMLVHFSRVLSTRYFTLFSFELSH